MFKRIKRVLELSKKDPKALATLESLTDEQLKAVPEIDDTEVKAEFFRTPTLEDEIAFERSEKGMDKWYNRLRNL